MRIEANGVNSSRLNGIESGNEPQPSTRIESDSARANGADHVSLSSTANDILGATKAVAELPDVREDKVAELKARIQAGQYNPSAEEIASKIIGG